MQHNKSTAWEYLVVEKWEKMENLFKKKINSISDVIAYSSTFDFSWEDICNKNCLNFFKILFIIIYMYVQVFTYRYTVHLQLYNNLHVNMYTSFPRWNYQYMLIFWCFSTCLAVFQTKLMYADVFTIYQPMRQSCYRGTCCI